MKQSFIPPETSLTAYRDVKSRGKDKSNADIVYNTLLLKIRGKMGTASDIAMNCELDYYEVNRRLSELVKAKRVFVVSDKGGKSFKRNQCRVYGLVETAKVEVNGVEIGNLFSKAI